MRFVLTGIHEYETRADQVRSSPSSSLLAPNPLAAPHDALRALQRLGFEPSFTTIRLS